MNVALQETLLVIVEQLVSIEAIGERRNTAARHAGDHTDVVKQARLITFRTDDFGIPQKLDTPYENAAARMPPPEKARITTFSLMSLE